MRETHACNKLVTGGNTSQRRIVGKEGLQLTETLHRSTGERANRRQHVALGLVQLVQHPLPICGGG